MSSSASSLGGLAFRVGGIPVRVAASFWFTSLLMGSRRMDTPVLLLEWVLVSLVSVLVHELGHATVARRLGQDVHIELHGLGGSAYHQGKTPLRPWQQVAVSLAGPGAGVLLGAVFLGLSLLPLPDHPVVHSALADALWVNWGYGLLNLLPIQPLDGGRVMQEVVNLVFPRSGERVGVIISLAGVLGLAVLGLVFGQTWVVFLLLFLGLREGQRALQVLREWQDERHQPALRQLHDALERQDGPLLVSRGQALLPLVRGERARATVVHALACGLVLEGRHAEALPVLQQMPASYRVDHALVAELAQHVEPGKALVDWLSGLWASAPDEVVLHLLATTLLKQGRVEDARELVQHAPPELVEESLVVAVDAAGFHAGRFADSLRWNETWFQRRGFPGAAYNAACAAARLGRTEDALTWLERAVDAGQDQAEQTQADEDLASLRGHPRFAAAVARMGERSAHPG